MPNFSLDDLNKYIDENNVARIPINIIDHKNSHALWGYDGPYGTIKTDPTLTCDGLRYVRTINTPLIEDGFLVLYNLTSNKDVNLQVLNELVNFGLLYVDSTRELKFWEREFPDHRNSATDKLA